MTINKKYLNFTEAIKDSPNFRYSLTENDAVLNKFRQRLEEVIATINHVVKLEEQLAAATGKINIGLSEIWKNMGCGNEETDNTFVSVSKNFSKTISANGALFESPFIAMRDVLMSFVKSDLDKLNETKIQFTLLSGNLDDALIKKAAISKQRVNEMNDAKNTLTSIGTCFAHVSLDYVAQINLINGKKFHVIVEAIWKYLIENSKGYKKNCYSLISFVDTDGEKVIQKIDDLKSQAFVLEKKMQERHSVVPKEIFQHPSGISLVPEVVMEGYLFKRSTNAFKTWNRRWFQIRDNTFLYSHRNNDNQVPTMMEENLKLCLVRQAPPNIDRMCCFELVTPSKTHILQADSEILCKGWIRALQRTIQHLHEECIHNTKEIPIFDDDKNELKHSPATTQSQMNDNGSEGSSEITPRGESNGQGKIKEAFVRSVIAPLSIREFYIQTRQLAGNTICCDCGCVDAKWISINLGIIICIECSGVHRSLGVQVSKVRSLTMDSLDCQQQDVMLSLGNKTVNSIFMEHYDKHKTQYPLISGETSRAEREIFIKAKYVHKLFTSSNKQRTNENGIYFNESGQEDDILSHQYLLLPTAETVSVKSFDRPESRTSDCSEGKFDKSDSDDYFNSDKITESIIGGNMAELLKCLAKGFDLNSIINGNTLLHIAVKNNNQSIIEFLVLNGAKINSFNEDLDTPLHVAVSVGDPLLVYQLIKRNADKSIKNRRGFTPLEWAVESEHANVVVLFRLVDLKSECTNTDSSNTMLDENIEDFLINLQMKENENNLSNV